MGEYPWYKVPSGAAIPGTRAGGGGVCPGVGSRYVRLVAATTHMVGKQVVRVARWKRESWCKVTRGFIPRKIHGTYIQAGGHKLTTAGKAVTLPYITCSWILIRWPLALQLAGQMARPWWWSVYQTWYPDILLSYKEEALPACEKLLHENIPWSWKDRVLHRFECITRKSLRKTLLTSIHSRPVCP